MHRKVVHVKTAIRELSNFNFYWTKTLYQNNLNNIVFFFLHFSRAIDIISIKDYLTWEPEKINVKFHKKCENRGKILKISCVRCHFVKSDIYFLGLLFEIFFGVITDN